MNPTAQYIKQRLSLREPLQASLDILAALAGSALSLRKDADPAAELERVRSLYPTCTDFEREFPSLAFSIATGVGKTRLMGAFIAYLHLEHGIRNFFVLAPNLTIYNKLVEDFGNPAWSKYVFAGIAEFVHNRPVIISGDNYAQQGALFGEAEVRINVFNISKFNSETRGTTQGGRSLAPRIKRLSEYLGQSYWEYLSGLEDLVILMDEAHRYHADRSKAAINELKPVLGLELTATPIDDNGGQFKNVVYEYSLAQALADGKYVKNPAIARRKDFKRGSMTDRELDIIKLEDAISLHEDTKRELELFALNEGARQVKPFILVVCKDTTHAKEIFELIRSDSFYEGAYREKVLQIDSTTKKDGGVEEQFLSLESPDNPIEVVVHVNMLKEGWDVSNLYTIVPLRAANAAILVEQTIGRGLRLPFNGRRTGVDKLDKLTVVAHENFDAVIAAAQDPNSVLNKMQFVEFDNIAIGQRGTVVSSRPVLEARLLEEQQRINTLPAGSGKQTAQNALDAKKAVVEALPLFNELPNVSKVEDLRRDDVKRKVLQAVEQKLQQGQLNIFAAQIVEEAAAVYESVVQQFKENIIEIPRIVVKPSETSIHFFPFELDTSVFSYQALDSEIIRMGLKDSVVDFVKANPSKSYGDPIKLIIAELINYPEIDYDGNAELLYHLAGQACEALRSNLSDPGEIDLVAFQFKAAIAERIYRQMKQNYKVTGEGFVPTKVLPFSRIEPWNFSAPASDAYKDFRDTVQPAGAIPRYIFRGFEKACHFEYKFDSRTEQDFAFILEHDRQVLKWLRPAPYQFSIYWDNNSKRYDPDFVAEIEEAIYIVETKMAKELEDADILAKKQAALTYCAQATAFTTEHGGKPWCYALVPDTAVTRTSSLAFLLEQFAHR